MSVRVFNHINGRLSLRPLQTESLDRLLRALAAAPEMLGHKRDMSAVLTSLKADFPMLKDFEREFPSLCFALATGVGKNWHQAVEIPAAPTRRNRGIETAIRLPAL